MQPLSTNLTHPDGAAVTKPGLGKIVRDTKFVFWRELLLVLRDPFSLVFSLLQPLIFLALFGPLLGAAVGTEAFGGESSLQWFLPGVVVMISLFGTTMTGSNLQYELMTGSYERILATPLSRSSLMIGRALKEWAPLVAQGLLIALVCIPFGFVFYPLHVLLGLLILGIFGIGIGALSYTLALITQGTEWVFWGVQQTLLFPLMILSGIMLPIEAGPGWMQALSRYNPLTYLVNAERELFAGTVGADTLWGLVAAVLTAAVGLAVGIRTTKKQTL
ncbi:ABC transporter permease [Arthrobacter sulfonylureivorans]|uniref:Transport permease protein n=1 Tax=Arthrobacter sulfonylureivorans TaxID=2486855 RepID=A0ABY3W474_9MICC|nr:ABC transporter permease [Arthrobacter sulfonylureivorans]UNK44985.1 ABC transporter permease [Arthrobacter sulfonylureivorans]